MLMLSTSQRMSTFQRITSSLSTAPATMTMTTTTLRPMPASSRRSTCALRFNDHGTLIVLTLVLLAVIDNTLAVRCYKCSVIEEKTIIGSETHITHMCSKFDESERFVSECEFSTMCLKTISSLRLQNGEIKETITRGCAPQKYTTQVFRDRNWHQEHTVQEVYQEVCEEFKDNNLAAAGLTHCYCRGDLCNAAQGISTMTNALYLKALAVTLFVNVVCRVF